MSGTIILGLKTSGKSTLAGEIASEYDKSIIWDPMHSQKSGDIIKVSDYSQIVSVYRKYASSKKFKVVIQPLDGVQPIPAVDAIIKVSKLFGEDIGTYQNQKQGKERLMILIDEADFVCKPNKISNEMAWLTNTGRHFSLSYICIARLPQRLHGDIRSICDRLISFKIYSDTALKYIRADQNDEMAEVIKGLEKYHFVDWQSDGSWKVFNHNHGLLAKHD